MESSREAVYIHRNIVGKRHIWKRRYTEAGRQWAEETDSR
jgi:hypothetical protein